MREGWELKPLKDVCEKTNNINWKNNTEKLFKYIDLSAVSRETLTITESSKINSLTAPSRAKKIINENDVIFATTRPTLNRMAIIPTEYNEDICSTGFTVLRAKVNIIEPKYIFYSLQIPSFMERMERMQRGASYPAVSDKDVKDFEIPIPPLKEQKQIVTTLDKAFKQIDQAKANLEKNLNNAKELFQSKLNEVFSQRGEGWEEKKLGAIASVEYGFTAKSTVEGTIRYVRITDIDKKGNLILDEKKYIENTKESQKFQLKDNDILMARTGATFAKVLLYKDYEPSVFASYLIRIHFDENISNELYWYFSKSQFYWSQANSLSSGSAQPHFNGKALKEVIFSYPKSEKKQQELIIEFKSLLDEIEKLETYYQQKLNNLEELKKSILQKAFKGELDYA